MTLQIQDLASVFQNNYLESIITAFPMINVITALALSIFAVATLNVFALALGLVYDGFLFINKDRIIQSLRTYNQIGRDEISAREEERALVIRCTDLTITIQNLSTLLT